MVQSQLHTRRSISRLGAAISSSSMFPISCVHLNFSQPSTCSAESPASCEASTQRPSSFSFPISKASRVHDSFLPAVTLSSSKSQHLETNIRPSVAIPTASVFSACESPVKRPRIRIKLIRSLPNLPTSCSRDAYFERPPNHPAFVQPSVKHPPTRSTLQLLPSSSHISSQPSASSARFHPDSQFPSSIPRSSPRT